MSKLDNHYYYGDAGGEKDIEILPHPYCEFCQMSLFNDIQLAFHMNREHYNCNVCGDKYKHIYYKNYHTLEEHFDKTHYLC